MRIAIIGAGNVGRAQWGEVVVLATPWPATGQAIAACGGLDGKVVLDATNPLRRTSPASTTPPAPAASASRSGRAARR